MVPDPSSKSSHDIAPELPFAAPTFSALPREIQMMCLKLIPLSTQKNFKVVSRQWKDLLQTIQEERLVLAILNATSQSQFAAAVKEVPKYLLCCHLSRLGMDGILTNLGRSGIPHGKTNSNLELHFFRN